MDLLEPSRLLNSWRMVSNYSRIEWVSTWFLPLSTGVGSVKVLKIEEMLEVQDVNEEIFGDLQDNQKTLSDEQKKSSKVSEEEESEEEYRKRTGQEPWTSRVPLRTVVIALHLLLDNPANVEILKLWS